MRANAVTVSAATTQRIWSFDELLVVRTAGPLGSGVSVAGACYSMHCAMGRLGGIPDRDFTYLKKLSRNMVTYDSVAMAFQPGRQPAASVTDDGQAEDDPPGVDLVRITNDDPGELMALAVRHYDRQVRRYIANRVYAPLRMDPGYTRNVTEDLATEVFRRLQEVYYRVRPLPRKPGIVYGGPNGDDPHRFRDNAQLGAWLRTTAINVTREYLRDLARREGLVQRVVLAGGGRSADHGDPDEVHEVYASEELLRVISEILMGLPLDVRRVAQLVVVDGLSQEEAAAQLGLTINRVRYRLKKAKTRLGRELKRRGYWTGAKLEPERGSGR